MLSLLFALLILLVSCSASDNNTRAENAPRSGEMSGGGGFDTNDSEMRLRMSDDPHTFSQNTSERMIIWNASMDIEAENAVRLHNLLIERAVELGGYQYTNDVRHHERHSAVNATFKIPPQNLRAFMAYAGDEGKVINSRLGSEDVTESYVDAQIRMETRRRSLEQYYRLLNDVTDIDGIVSLRRIIDGITEDIEALEGRLRMWDNLTDMATVHILIRQENDPFGIRRDISWSSLSWSDMGYLISRGFVTVASTFFTIVQWIFIALLVTSPLWIIALGVLWIIYKLKKRKRISASPPQDPQE
jgi:phage FluMu protein gp41